jgi:leucyl-tRNA synthetase
MDFDFRKVEEKWRKDWEEKGIYKVTEDPSRPKYYVLDMFPYPSGAGLHVGHPLGYVASDIYARYKRLKGFNVLHPMGYDAFGLPAEQYAIETGTPPEVTTEKAIKTYRGQLDKIGFSYDWSRQVKTCEPGYYKWTQWIFLQLFDSWYNREKNKAENIFTLESFFAENGCVNWPQHDKDDHPEFTDVEWNNFTVEQQEQILMHYRIAYQSFSEVNWCEALGTVLANDEVKDGKSERGGYPVERRKMRQWFLRITEYADRLLSGLDTLDWSDAMKDMQRNWIGRSEGALVNFKIAEKDGLLTVFTTRPDTIYGATFMVIAPEHELINSLTTPAQQKEIEDYIAYVKSRTDVERQQEKKVTGAFTGSYAVNPFTGTNIPIYIAEYVLAGYGTGAIMAVPADDERDRKFAEKFGLPIIEVIDKSAHPGAEIGDKVGTMINSGFLNGKEVKDAIKYILNEIEDEEIGKRKVNYRLRDAGYSRQRYWGEPFPIVYKNDIPYPLPVEELPLVLPQVDSYKPSGDGRSPIANNKAWVNLPDGSQRETDTMPGYAGSSWYFLRYMDPNNDKEFASKDKLNYWQSVDLYLGGNEHAVGHLLYARLWHKFLYDMGYVPTDEPFKKLVNQGMIQGVSSFVYRLIPNNGKPIFISYDIVKKIALPPLGFGLLDSQAVIALLPMLQTELEQDAYLAFVGEIWIDKIHVDISFVKNDELDIERFKAWRTEYADAILIHEDGKVTCGSAVEKMSKSKYNVVNPDEVIEKYGADAFRMFEMFLGPLDQSKPWDQQGIDGVGKFIRRFWRLFYDEKGTWRLTADAPTPAEYKVLHKTIKKIAEDIERLQFNTCISQFMIAMNELNELKCTKRDILEPLLITLAPFAPFLTEELWQALGNSGSIHHATFPKFEEKYLVESAFTYPVSINGKVRAEIPLALDLDEAAVKAAVLGNETIQKWTNGAEPKKFIFVKGRIINVVV